MILKEQIGKDTPEFIVTAINVLNKTIGKSLNNVDCWVAGGFFRAVFNEESVQNIDIFFSNANDVENARELLEITHESDHSFRGNLKKSSSSLSDDENSHQIDIVKSLYTSPEELLKGFDFSVCKFAYSFKDKTLYYDNRAFVHLKAKRLVITDKDFSNPVGCLRRLKKYFEYGYTISAESINAISMRIVELGSECITNNTTTETYENIEQTDAVKINAYDLELPDENWKELVELNPYSILHKSFPVDFSKPLSVKTQMELTEIARKGHITSDKIQKFCDESTWHRTRGKRLMEGYEE